MDAEKMLKRWLTRHVAGGAAVRGEDISARRLELSVHTTGVGLYFGMTELTCFACVIGRAGRLSLCVYFKTAEY